jgi:hypothetical protein
VVLALNHGRAAGTAGIYSSCSCKDPLAPYRMLKESAEEKFQLTSPSPLREILGLSQSTINSWGAEVRRNGFLIEEGWSWSLEGLCQEVEDVDMAA